MLDILFITVGDSKIPSSRIRVLNYLKLIKNDINYKIIFNKKSYNKNNLISRTYFFIYKRYAFFLRILYLFLYRPKIIFFQKINPSILDIILLKLNKSKLIFDLDDALFMVSETTNKETLRTIKLADKIIVSTSELSNFINQPQKTIVIHSSVDSSIFNPIKSNLNDKFLIGWSGTATNLKFLESIINQIDIILKKHNNCYFIYMCDKKLTKGSSNKIIHVPWSEEEEPKFIQNLNLGLMPLENDEWCRYKGGYKLFMYLMCNVPVLASSVGVNKKIVKHNINGFLAQKNEDWLNYMETMIQNIEKYNSIRENIENEDKSYFDLSFNSKRFNEVIKSVLVNER